MKEFKELLMKKKAAMKESMPENHKKAKMGILSELKDMMNGRIAQDLKGMKKVTVASDSEEGLKAGLDKAEDIIDKKDALEPNRIADEGESDDEKLEDALSPYSESEDSSDKDESEEMSDEEIDEMIADLQAKKSRK